MRKPASRATGPTHGSGSVGESGVFPPPATNLDLVVHVVHEVARGLPVPARQLDREGVIPVVLDRRLVHDIDPDDRSPLPGPLQRRTENLVPADLSDPPSAVTT